MATKTEEKAPSIDKTHAEPARLLAEEHRWSERRAQIVASIAAAEATAGGRVLDGGDGALRAQADSLVSQRAEVDGCDAAIQEARRRRGAAILVVYAADAQALRSRAGSLRAEADERQQTTDGLLAQLRDHEGCEYRPVPSLETQVAALGMGSKAQLEAMGLTGQPDNVPPARTDALRAEAESLEQQASALERRPVQDSGAVRAESRGGLLGALHGLDPLTIGPTLSDVEGWLAVAEREPLEQVRIRTARHGAPASLEYSVTWAHGELDRVRCHCDVREHAGRVAGPTQAA